MALVSNQVIRDYNLGKVTFILEMKLLKCQPDLGGFLWALIFPELWLKPLQHLETSELKLQESKQRQENTRKGENTSFQFLCRWNIREGD